MKRTSNIYLLALFVTAPLAGACVISETDDETDGSGGSSATGGDSSTGGTGGITTGSGGDGTMGGSTAEGGSSAGEAYIESCPDSAGGASGDDNNTPETAVAVTTHATLCVGEDDVDWLKVTAPDDGKAHPLHIKVDQDSEVRISLLAQAGADNSEIGRRTFAKGVTESVFLTVGPGTTTLLKFEPYSGSGLVDLAFDLGTEQDPFEPNNERSEAKTINTNEDVSAQFMIPYVSASEQSPDDWYAIDLEEGSATVTLDPVPENVRFTVRILDATNDEIERFTTANNGALLVGDAGEFTVDTAGMHKIVIEHYGSDRFSSLQYGTEPKHYSETYTLNVSQ